MDDRVLLGSILAQHLGPLCFDPYVVEAVLLPLLDDTAGELAGGIKLSLSGSSGDIGAAIAAAAGASTGAAEPGDASPAAAAAGADSGSGSGGGGGGDGGDGGRELGRRRLAELLDLLAAVLEPVEVSALVSSSCQVSASSRQRACLHASRPARMAACL